MFEGYQQEFIKIQHQLAGHHLPWLKQLRENALATFMKQGFPTLRDEEWKYTNIAPITKKIFKLAQKPINEILSAATISPFINADLDCYRLVFIDGYFIEKFSSLAGLSSDITLMSMSDACEKHSSILQTHLNQPTNNSIMGFNNFNTVFFHDGAYIHLSPNSIGDKPIELLFIATAQQEAYTMPLRNLIVAGQNSQAKIIESYVSLDHNNHFTNSITELVIEEKAIVEHYKCLQENTRAFHIGTLQVKQQAHSHFTSHSFALGGALVRSDINVSLDAEHAECELNGLYVLNDQQHVDHHTLIDHAKSHGTSREYYKGIIADRGRAVFNGKVYVHPNAQKTNATQNNKNLLLSENAEIDTKPQLEIYADDVQCTHGATVGQLDNDALFYLRARGIDETEARNALIYAFAREMLERVSIKSLRTQLETTLNEKF